MQPGSSSQYSYRSTSRVWHCLSSVLCVCWRTIGVGSVSTTGQSGLLCVSGTYSQWLITILLCSRDVSRTREPAVAVVGLAAVGGGPPASRDDVILGQAVYLCINSKATFSIAVYLNQVGSENMKLRGALSLMYWWAATFKRDRRQHDRSDRCVQRRHRAWPVIRWAQSVTSNLSRMH